MPMIPCRECQHPISPNARNCPRCGAPSPADKKWNGTGFEWKSQRTVYGYPLIHVAYGRDAKGKKRIARGVIAIGQYGVGMITIAQFGVAFVFGLGQFMLAPLVIGQFAIALFLAVGQFAIGYAVVGQFAVGSYAICQIGWARHLWSVSHRDPEALQFFINLLQKIGIVLNKPRY